MWALVENGKVVEVYGYPKSVVINDIRYPPDMFTLHTEDEKKQIGVYDVQPKEKPDSRFHTFGEVSFSYDADNEVVKETFVVADKSLDDVETDARDDHDNFIINEGLKTQQQNECKREAHHMIQRYQWLVERYIYDNTKTIPDAVATYVENVRSTCATVCAAIENCSDIDALKAVETNWPDDYLIRDYIR